MSIDYSNMNNKKDGFANKKTIIEIENRWYWLDEEEIKHGPCSSYESARSRQSLYCKWLIEDLNIVSVNEWIAARNRESADTIHPCTHPNPWDCDCAGSCSCHWKNK